MDATRQMHSQTHVLEEAGERTLRRMIALLHLKKNRQRNKQTYLLLKFDSSF